jgi:uncharacterized iron-regulated protein
VAKAILAALSLLLAACAPPPPEVKGPTDHPLTEQIWLVEENRFITPAELVRRWRPARYILVGEQHDNPRHQAIEAWVVRALVEANRRPALVMEMIAADQAPALKLFFTEPRRNAQGLDLFLKWDQSGWGPWALYRPVIDAAILGEMPVLAGNLDRSLLPQMHRSGFQALPADTRTRLELPAAVPEDLAPKLAAAVQDGHCGHLPDHLVRTFAEIQYARDAALARALMDGASTAEGAILVSGAEHVRTDRAVPVHLRRFGERGRIFSLGLVETKPGLTAPIDYFDDAPPFTAVWFTAPVTRADPCAGLAQKLTSAKP